MTDKERIIMFVIRAVPNDIECGNISLVFNEDDSASILINNKEDNDGD